MYTFDNIFWLFKNWYNRDLGKNRSESPSVRWCPTRASSPLLDPFGHNRIHFGQFWLQIFSSIIITDFWYESEVSSSKIRFLDPFWTLFGPFLDPFGPFLGTLEYIFGNFDSKSFIKIHFWYESQAFSSKTRYLAFLDLFLDPFGTPKKFKK